MRWMCRFGNIFESREQLEQSPQFASPAQGTAVSGGEHADEAGEAGGEERAHEEIEAPGQGGELLAGFAAQFSDIAFHTIEAVIDLFETGIDLRKADINLLEASIDLGEPGIHLRKAGIHMGETSVDALDEIVHALVGPVLSWHRLHDLQAIRVDLTCGA